MYAICILIFAYSVYVYIYILSRASSTTACCCFFNTPYNIELTIYIFVLISAFSTVQLKYGRYSTLGNIFNCCF